jgi:hypothetical protein
MENAATVGTTPFVEDVVVGLWQFLEIIWRRIPPVLLPIVRDQERN